jgi:diketogulonate reductase-like aldo/keto reductase
MQAAGTVGSLAVSNFSPQQLDVLLKVGAVEEGSMVGESSV